MSATYVHRLLLFVVSMLGAWIALGGDLSGLEWAFFGICVVLNETRIWFRLDRWPKLVFGLWTIIFLILPTLYFMYRLFPGFENFSLVGMGPARVLPIAVIAMALPFQVFAAYYAGMPRAHHLILIFA
ncbi:MAG: hypothetical protein KDB07_09650, partial [Planctomycetes bacterium]|nr:hypothetical protein [Planctomycetota bacterium]